MDTEDEDTPYDVSGKCVTASDVTRVEGICKEMGFVMCANQSTRWVYIVAGCCYRLLMTYNCSFVNCKCAVLVPEIIE